MTPIMAKGREGGTHIEGRAVSVSGTSVGALGGSHADNGKEGKSLNHP